MLIWLTKRCRFGAAIALATIYAVCVVAPSVALAFADGAVAAHCLPDDNHGLAPVHALGDGRGIVHTHDDGTVHEHANQTASAQDGEGEQTKPVGSCCGLFCFAAVTSDLDVAIGQPVHMSCVLPVLDEHLDGRGPDRINRPPIPLLSL
jgi:hypothetical protein